MNTTSNISKDIGSPEVLVVEASAGTGKTYALVKRYIRILMDFPESSSILRSILAITFTNRATIEMKERIIQTLKEMALGIIPQDRLSDILGERKYNRDFVQEKAKKIMDDLVKYYNFFQVQTIDSFINALLIGCAFNLGYSANFKIEKDYGEYISYAFDNMIDRALSDHKILEIFEEFLQHYLFVENKQGWFPKKDILKVMNSLLQVSNKYGKDFFVPAISWKELIIKKQELYNEINELFFILPDGVNKTARNSIKRFIEGARENFPIVSIPSCFEREDPPLNKGTKCGAELKRKWLKIRKKIKEIAELDAIYAYLPYIKLYREILNILEMVCREKNVLFLGSLNRSALFLWKNNISVGEIYYRLASRYRHYLIDEFQDTSVLQWRNLQPMIEEALSTGGTLFYVGDKKQAIYRFRGGDARLFDKIKEKFSIFDVKTNYLTKNWRSRKAIVEFNNKIFSWQNLEMALGVLTKEGWINKEDIEDIKFVFKDAYQQVSENKEGGYVYVEFLEEENISERNDLMREKLIDLVKSLIKRGYNYEDIVILVRDNNEVEMITAWFMNEGINVESEKTLNVLEHNLIKEVISFLKFLYTPLDNISFVRFILGDLFTRRTNLSFYKILDFLIVLNRNIGTVNTVVYREFQRCFPEEWKNFIEPFFNSVGFISLYELVIMIYEKYNIHQYFYRSQAFFMKFLELIKVKEDDCPQLRDFLNYLDNASLEDLYINIPHSRSVKILTIHKAKGLQFPVTILPFLKISIRPADVLNNSFILDDVKNDKLSLLRITKEHYTCSKFLHSIYREAYKRSFIDELNNMYVGLTRAQQELYIFLPTKSGTGKNIARLFFPKHLREVGQKLVSVSLPENDKNVFTIPPSQYTDWEKALMGTEFIDTDVIEKRVALSEGNIFHKLLSYINNCLGEDIERLIENACHRTEASYPHSDYSIYAKRLKQLLSSKKLKDIFYVEYGDVFCEKEVVDKNGNLRRIDRLIVKKGEVLIIDYKSSHEDVQEHYRQVKEYMEIVKDIYPGRDVKGIIVYLDSLTQEEIRD